MRGTKHETAAFAFLQFCNFHSPFLGPGTWYNSATSRAAMIPPQRTWTLGRRIAIADLPENAADALITPAKPAPSVTGDPRRSPHYPSVVKRVASLRLSPSLSSFIGGAHRFEQRNLNQEASPSR
jgi:hypothetical protein